MIKRIRITDFKSIRELDLELDPVTVLIGRSGTGKSNVVQAIRFLRNLLLDYQRAIEYEHGWERIKPVGVQSPNTSIKITFEVPGESLDYTYEIAFNLNPHWGREPLFIEKLLLGEEMLFWRTRTTQGWKWEKAPALETAPLGLDGPILGRFPAFQKIVLAYAALSNGIGYYHFPASTLSAFRHSNHGEEFLMKVPGLADNAGNYLDVIRKIVQDFHHPNIRKSLLASLQAVNPSIASVELDSLTNPNHAIVAHTANGQIFELSLEQESDGIRRFYAHLLALYQSPPKLAMVFEEPENAIFPGALSLLADEFKAAPRENRGQIILTTHNPTLLDSFDVENVRVVEMREGRTVVGKVSKEQREAVKDHLLTTGELLTVEQPRLEEPPKSESVA